MNNAEATIVNFQWQGNQGYWVEGTLNYNEEKTPKIISEQGEGKANYLNNLSISIYNSEHELIRSYENIQNQVVTGKYFRFNFNTETKQVMGKIDIGGESAGDVYLKGKVQDNLSLFKVTQLNTDTMLDQNQGNFKIGNN